MMVSVLPLSGLVVLDVTRMLPGAVLVRHLVDMGARVIKVEDPAGGDPMRSIPPTADGIGAGYQAFFRGTESVTVDLRTRAGALALLQLSRHADVFLESFRPGTLDKWGIPVERLRSVNPGLVSVSLSSFGAGEPWAQHVGHDLNFTGLSGALVEMNETDVPRIQLADISSGLLALSAVLSGLLIRQKTGRGTHFEQPLASGPLPFVVWSWADASAGGGSVVAGLLGGRAPAYRRYRCADGVEITLGAIEPKFWVGFLSLLELTGLAGDGFDCGERGEAAAGAVARRLAEQPSTHWLAMAVEKGLPVSAVRTPGEALREPVFSESGLVEEIVTPSGAKIQAPASPFQPFRRPLASAPSLGEHTMKVAAEFGIDRQSMS